MMEGVDDMIDDGVEHLQRAAREMIAAARSFLDAIERVVEDREAVRDVSATVSDVAATVLESVRGGSRPAPWAESAWESRETAPDAPDARTGTGVQEKGDETEDWARPLIDADAPRRPSRVRRIAVE